MIDLFPSIKYVFDTGPFIDLKNYPEDVFASLWERFKNMINNGEIISSSEVLRDLEHYDDIIAEWAKANKKIFIKPTIEEQIIVKEISQLSETLNEEPRRKQRGILAFSEDCQLSVFMQSFIFLFTTLLLYIL
jgi:hypothetical protein